jgi:hypothetical protein
MKSYIEIINWLWPPWEVEYGGKKRTGRDEAIGTVLDMCMETTQGNSLCSCLYLKLAK